MQGIIGSTTSRTTAFLLLVLVCFSTASTNERRRAGIGKQLSTLNQGASNQRRKLPKGPHPKPHVKRNSGDDWLGCLNFNCSELQSFWHYPGPKPECKGHHLDCSESDGAGGDDTGSSGGSGGSGGGGGGDDDTSRSSTDDDKYGNGGSPVDSFDINDCSTYQNYWVWDLAITCESNDNLKSCQCATAETMMEQGLLSCPDGSDENPYCPDDCTICHDCLKMLGCEQTAPEEGSGSRFSLNFIPFLLAGLAGIILGILAMWVQRNRSSMNDDSASLLAGSEAGDNNVWLAPVS